MWVFKILGNTFGLFELRIDIALIFYGFVPVFQFPNHYGKEENKTNKEMEKSEI